MALAALLTGSAGAFAQQSATITSGGTVTPGSCNLSVTNTNFGWGSFTKDAFLAFADGQPHGYTSTTDKTVRYIGNINYGINVTCDSPQRVALEFVDNYAAKAPLPSDLINPSSGTVWENIPFASVDAGTGSTSGYAFFFNSGLTINGGSTPGTKLQAPNGTVTWTPLTSTTPPIHHTSLLPGYTLALTPSASQVSPEPISSIEGSVGSDHWILRDYFANASGVVNFSTNATITLRYY